MIQFVDKIDTKMDTNNESKMDTKIDTNMERKSPLYLIKVEKN